MKNGGVIMDKRKPFTLIELLVVIAIIALLMAILMPALYKAKAQAESVRCKSHVKQMHLGVFMYAQDNNGKPFDYNYSRGLYLQRMVDYLSNIEEIRYCPSTKVGQSKESLSHCPTAAYGTARMTWFENFVPNPSEGGEVTPEYGSYTYNGWMYSKMPGGVGDETIPEE